MDTIAWADGGARTSKTRGLQHTHTHTREQQSQLAWDEGGATANRTTQPESTTTWSREVRKDDSSSK
jgi:hypothetical protein